MKFPEDTGMVGFDLPSFEEYCQDHQYEVDDIYRQDYEEYCQDLLDEMENNKYIGPKGSIDRTLNLADEAYERSIDA